MMSYRASVLSTYFCGDKGFSSFSIDKGIPSALLSSEVFLSKLLELIELHPTFLSPKPVSILAFTVNFYLYFDNFACGGGCSVF
jgi:hypothetical protein